MRDLLSELYNKVLNFFQQSEKEVASKDIASNRLKLVLMQDRTNLDSSTIEKMRIELVEVISKYVEIDTEEFNVNLEGVGDSIALMLNIPVIRAKTPEEIEEATKKAEEEKEETSSEENAEETEESEKSEETEETAENAEESAEEETASQEEQEEVKEETEEKQESKESAKKTNKDTESEK